MLETVVKRRVITLLANMDFGLSDSFFKTRIFETTTDSLVDLQLHFGPDYTPILEQYSKFVSLLEELIQLIQKRKRNLLQDGNTGEQKYIKQDII